MSVPGQSRERAISNLALLPTLVLQPRIVQNDQQLESQPCILFELITSPQDFIAINYYKINNSNFQMLSQFLNLVSVTLAMFTSAWPFKIIKINLSSNNDNIISQHLCHTYYTSERLLFLLLDLQLSQQFNVVSINISTLQVKKSEAHRS